MVTHLVLWHCGALVLLSLLATGCAQTTALEISHFGPTCAGGATGVMSGRATKTSSCTPAPCQPSPLPNTWTKKTCHATPALAGQEYATQLGSNRFIMQFTWDTGSCRNTQYSTILFFNWGMCTPSPLNSSVGERWMVANQGCTRVTWEQFDGNSNCGVAPTNTTSFATDICLVNDKYVYYRCGANARSVAWATIIGLLAVMAM